MSNLEWRLPAEWEPQEFVLLSWPHEATDWHYMLHEAQDCFARIAEAIAKHAKLLIVAPDIDVPKRCLKGRVPADRALFYPCETNDTWARDFGMICTVGKLGNVCINDFKFNGWGLKFPADADNLVTMRMVGDGLAGDNSYYANLLSFVLEGGSIDTDGAGTLLTTSECLLSPNRNGGMNREQIERFLLYALGCERMVWLDHGALEGDDTDSHVDTLARFLPGGIIAYSSCDRPDDSHYVDLKAMEAELQALRKPDGEPYALLPLPIPQEIRDEHGERLPATYANFLLINGAILMPTYADPHYDALAQSALAKALPDWDVVPIDCRPLIRQHGSLHCVTMQLPPGAIK